MPLSGKTRQGLHYVTCRKYRQGQIPKARVAVKTSAGKLISHESSADAHSRHDYAKRSAQIEKNAMKVASHDLHKIPGKENHHISDKEKSCIPQGIFV